MCLHFYLVLFEQVGYSMFLVQYRNMQGLTKLILCWFKMDLALCKSIPNAKARKELRMPFTISKTAILLILMRLVEVWH